MAVLTLPEFDVVYGVREAELCNRSLWRIGAEAMRDSEEDTKPSRACKVSYSQTRDELLRMFAFPFACKTVRIPLDAAYDRPIAPYTRAYKAEDHKSITATAAAAMGDLAITAGWTNTASMIPLSSLAGREIVGAAFSDGTRIKSVALLGTTPETATITLDRPTVAAVAIGDIAGTKLSILKILEIGGSKDTIYDTVMAGESRRILCNVETGADEDLNTTVSLKYVERVIDPEEFDPMFQDALVLRVASKVAVSMAKSTGLKRELEAEFSAVMQQAQVASLEEKVDESGEQFWTENRNTQGAR